MLLAVCHSDRGWSRIEDLGTLSDLRAETGNLLWVEADAANLTEEDIGVLAEEFGLDPLAVEDATAPRQRPKIESYSEHIFMTLDQLDEVDGQLEPAQLGIFVGPRYVLMIHHDAGRTIEAAKARWRDAQGSTEAQGPAHLIHTLLDVIVDEYQSYADDLEAKIEDLEEIALTAPDAPIQRQLYSVKQRSSRLRRFALPVERVTLELLNLEDMQPHLPDETRNLFRDVQDHMIRITAQLRTVDDLSQAVLDLVRGTYTERLGEQGRKLSAWAAIFAVGTLIAGVYGMNFELLPEENSLGGFWFAIGLMGASTLGLYFWFKKRGWL